MPTPPDFSNGTSLDASSLNRISLWKMSPTAVAGCTISSDGDIIVTNGAASFSVNNAFTADYDYYRVHFLLNGNTSGQFARFRVRSGGVDIATGTYYQWGFSTAWNAAALTPYNLGAQQQYVPVGQWGAGLAGTCWMEISEPANPAVRTRFKSELNDPGLGSGYFQQGLVEGGRVDDGFTVFIIGGTFSSGVVRVYGYRN